MKQKKKSSKAPARVARARIRVVAPANEMQTVFDVQLGLELQARIGHTFRSIGEESARRAARWHPGGIESWNTLEWAGAMCGEAGEAANVAKKLARFDAGLSQKKAPKDRAALVAALASEIAGTYLYLDLLAQREGIDIRAAIVAEFNRVSEREGFPERL